MRRTDAWKGVTGCFVMGLLALAGCGRKDAPSDAAPLRSSSAALEEAADLVVTEVSGPASVTPYENFLASVTVCNQSNWGSYHPPRVELFLSMDTELTLPDPSMPYPVEPEDQRRIGYVELNQYLEPWQCVTTSVNASAYLPLAAQGDGAYYLAAVVSPLYSEPELREDNNVLVGDLMGVGYLADLVVAQVSGPPNVENGQSFLASVTVCNQGTSATPDSYSSMPRVSLFLPPTSELPMPPLDPYGSAPLEQIAIGSVMLDQPLNPGQCVTKSVSASAGSQWDGAYYLAAAVDMVRVVQELREDNNVFVGARMGVGYRPDLVVAQVSGPASMAPGQGFSATVKVCNQGTTRSSSLMPRVELFLSTDTELTLPSPGTAMDQSLIGYVDLEQPLDPGQCMTKNVSASAAPPPGAQPDGAYYLAAAIDTTQVEQELIEDNNVLVGALMGVGYRPDLVVTGVSGPASLHGWENATATVTVCNQGTAPSLDTATLMMLLSMDAQLTMPTPTDRTLSTDQVNVGYDQVEPLPAGQCVTKNVGIFASQPPDAEGPGVFYLGALIDVGHQVVELREDNNGRADTTLEVIP